MKLDFPDNDEYWNNKHCKTLADKMQWVESASELIEAATVLRPAVVAYWQELDREPEVHCAPRVHGIYLMLVSYAAENLIKAIIIEEKRLNEASFTSGLPGLLGSHDLVDLLHEARMAISDTGKELLVRLSAYTYWAGRYPAPLKAKFLHPIKLGNKEAVVPSIKGYDLRMVEKFLKSLYVDLGVSIPICLGSLQHPEPPESWENLIVMEKITPWGDGTISGAFQE